MPVTMSSTWSLPLPPHLPRTQLTPSDLAYLAGEPPVALLCELVHPTDPKGTMARRDDSWRFARSWGLKCISIADLQAYLNSPQGDAVPQ